MAQRLVENGLARLRAVFALSGLALSFSGCCGCGDLIEQIFLTPSASSSSGSSNTGEPSPLPPPSTINDDSVRPPSDQETEARPGLAAGVPAPLTAPFGVKLTTEIDHYDVEGKTADAIRSDINKKRSVGEDGAHDARTHWYVTWTFQKVPAAGQCALEDVNVKLSIRYQLPRWDAQKGAPASLTGRWNRYMTALAGHERNHALHGVSAAEEIHRMLESRGAARTCSGVEAEANRQAHAILDKYRGKDAAYDSRTKHGKTEGAVFP